MDGRVEQLQKKLEDLLKAAAEASAELQKIDGSQPEVPHYSQIENTAHATGQQLSRMIQQARLQEVALAARPQAACPTCGDVCEVAHPLTPGGPSHPLTDPSKPWNPKLTALAAGRVWLPRAESFSSLVGRRPALASLKGFDWDWTLVS